MNPAERLMENLVSSIEEQITAAKKLDAERLGEATAYRQDLLFELELERKNNNVVVTEKMKKLQYQISRLDERLMAILSTVNKACEGMKTNTPAKVYGANGRIRR